MMPNGSVAYQYRDPDLAGPLGICVDTEDSIMVCDYNSNNVHVVCADGIKSHILLTSKDGIKSPLSVAYRHTDHSLIVGSFMVDTLFTYKVKHNA